MSSENQSKYQKYESEKLYGKKYRVVGYLKPKMKNFFDAYVAFNDGESESSCLEEMIKHFYNNMPEQQRQRILNHSKNSY